MGQITSIPTRYLCPAVSALFVIIAIVLFSCTTTSSPVPSPLPVNGNVASGTADRNAPAITWTPGQLTESVGAGLSKAVSVSFTSSKNLTNVNVRVVPELQPYVQATPSTFASIAAGQGTTVNLMLSAPATALPSTVEGAVQLKDSHGNTIARPLAITITVLATANVVSDGVVISFAYPTGWTSYSDSPNEHVLDSPSTVAALAGGDRETRPDIVVQILDNPLALPVAEFAAADENGWFSHYQVQSSLTVNGQFAVLFSDQTAQLPHEPVLAAFVAAGNKIVVIVGDDSSMFNLVLNSLQFP